MGTWNIDMTNHVGPGGKVRYDNWTSPQQTYNPAGFDPQTQDYSSDTFVIDFSGFAGRTVSNLTIDRLWFFGDGYINGSAQADSFEFILPPDWTMTATGQAFMQGPYWHLHDANGDRFTIPNHLGSQGFWTANGNVTISNICFTAGTKLLCEDGMLRAVEDLDEGDLVMTKDAGLQPLKWVGKSPVSSETLEQFPNRRPIVFEPGAIGNTDRLRVSPQHKMLVTGAMDGGPEEERLVPAKHLVNDHNIYVDNSCEDVDYYHVMFEQHQVVLSENAWSESFWPGAYIRDVMDPIAWSQVEFFFPELATESDPLKAYGQPARTALKRKHVEVFLNENREMAPA